MQHTATDFIVLQANWSRKSSIVRESHVRSISSRLLAPRVWGCFRERAEAFMFLFLMAEAKNYVCCSTDLVVISLAFKKLI